jgi:hypothetical protein
MREACWRRLTCSKEIRWARVWSRLDKKHLRGGQRWRSSCGRQLARE